MIVRTRPAGAPAYYLARPAALWLTASRRQPVNATSARSRAGEGSAVK